MNIELDKNTLDNLRKARDEYFHNVNEVRSYNDQISNLTDKRDKAAQASLALKNRYEKCRDQTVNAILLKELEESS